MHFQQTKKYTRKPTTTSLHRHSTKTNFSLIHNYLCRKAKDITRTDAIFHNCRLTSKICNFHRCHKSHGDIYRRCMYYATCVKIFRKNEIPLRSMDHYLYGTIAAGFPASTRKKYGFEYMRFIIYGQDGVSRGYGGWKPSRKMHVYFLQTSYIPVSCNISDDGLASCRRWYGCMCNCCSTQVFTIQPTRLNFGYIL